MRGAAGEGSCPAKSARASASAPTSTSQAQDSSRGGVARAERKGAARKAGLRWRAWTVALMVHSLAIRPGNRPALALNFAKEFATASESSPPLAGFTGSLLAGTDGRADIHERGARRVQPRPP